MGTKRTPKAKPTIKVEKAPAETLPVSHTMGAMIAVLATTQGSVLALIGRDPETATKLADEADALGAKIWEVLQEKPPLLKAMATINVLCNIAERYAEAIEDMAAIGAGADPDTLALAQMSEEDFKKA